MDLQIRERTLALHAEESEEGFIMLPQKTGHLPLGTEVVRVGGFFCLVFFCLVFLMTHRLYEDLCLLQCFLC